MAVVGAGFKPALTAQARRLCHFHFAWQSFQGMNYGGQCPPCISGPWSKNLNPPYPPFVKGGNEGGFDRLECCIAPHTVPFTLSRDTS